MEKFDESIQENFNNFYDNFIILHGLKKEGSLVKNSVMDDDIQI